MQNLQSLTNQSTDLSARQRRGGVFAAVAARALTAIAWLLERIAILKEGGQVFAKEDILRYEKQLPEKIKYLESVLARHF